MYHRPYQPTAKTRSQLTPAQQAEAPAIETAAQPGLLTRAAVRSGSPAAQAERLSQASGGRLRRAGQVLLQMQRQHGNHYVQQVVNQVKQEINPQGAPTIQTKLVVNAAADKYEREADSVAARVVQEINMNGTPHSSQGHAVQRHPENSEGIQSKPIGALDIGSENRAASPEFEAAIHQNTSGGEPLPDTFRASVERAMGADFSRVKVHPDAQSDRLNRAISAKAFTTGQNIFFRAGAYAPGSRAGQKLIAHELTHVLQQNGDVNRRQAGKPCVAVTLETRGKAVQRESDWAYLEEQLRKRRRGASGYREEEETEWFARRSGARATAEAKEIGEQSRLVSKRVAREAYGKQLLETSGARASAEATSLTQVPEHREKASQALTRHLVGGQLLATSGAKATVEAQERMQTPEAKERTKQAKQSVARQFAQIKKGRELLTTAGAREKAEASEVGSAQYGKTAYDAEVSRLKLTKPLAGVEQHKGTELEPPELKALNTAITAKWWRHAITMLEPLKVVIDATKNTFRVRQLAVMPNYNIARDEKLGYSPPELQKLGQEVNSAFQKDDWIMLLPKLKILETMVDQVIDFRTRLVEIEKQAKTLETLKIDESKKNQYKKNVTGWLADLNKASWEQRAKGLTSSFEKPGILFLEERLATYRGSEAAAAAALALEKQRKERGLIAGNGKIIAEKPVTDLTGTGEQDAVNDALTCRDNGTVPALSHPNNMKWGAAFNNNDGDLPGAAGAGGYREYYVEKDPTDVTYHGSRRLVVKSSNNNVYYTWTHYGDNGKPAFVRIR